MQSLWHSNSKFVEILGDQEFLPSESVLEDVNAYPWAINTKYYTAQVMLCTVPSRTIGDELFAKRVEAFIVHFDSAKVWEPYNYIVTIKYQILVLTERLKIMQQAAIS